MIENKWEIDFPGAGLVASRRVRNLQVRDVLQILAYRRREIALHDLPVIDVVLHPEIWRSDAFYDVGRLRRRVEKVRWNVARVDRLDQQRQAFVGERLRCKAQVVEICLAQGAVLGADWRGSRQAVKLRAAKRFRIADRSGYAFAKLPDGIRIDRDAPLAHRPIAGRHIEKNLAQSIRLQPGGEIFSLVVVRKEKFDSFEAGRRCGFESVEERQFRE